jgi:putative transcriptional regulator
VRAAAALLLAACLLACAGARAQQGKPEEPRPNGLLLIAKPGLTDANFARTVVLITQTEDGGTVGVILNRPTQLRLQQFLSGEFDTSKYAEPVYAGGPVMRQALVAVFRSGAAPKAPAFHVLKGIYMTMHPDNIASLLSGAGARYRIYAGFAGWAPRQLQSEVMRDGWYFLQADEATIFRKDVENMWEELLERARKSDSRGRS